MSGISLLRVRAERPSWPDAAKVWQGLRAVLVAGLALATVAVMAGLVIPSMGGPATSEQTGAFLTGWAALPAATLLVLALAGASPGGWRSPANQSMLIGVTGWFLVFASLITYGLAAMAAVGLVGLGLAVFDAVRQRDVLAVWGVALNSCVLLGVMFVRSAVAYM